MSLPERTYRVNTSRSPTITTMEQFRRGESSRMSPTYSPTYSKSPSSPYFERLKHHDPEEDQGFYQRKSVLAKMREGARRLMRNSFSKRKQEDGNLTPSWGVSLEDDEEEEEEEDPEYLGAPMYETELAPEGYKENARQHPRANPVISEKHVLRSTKSGVEQDQEKSPSPIKSTTTTTTQAATTTLPSQNRTMTENLAKKLTPTNAEGYSDSDAANFISSKIQGLSVSRTTNSANISNSQNSSSAPLPTQTSLSSSSSLNGRNSSIPKGASVKEYLKIKFEPGNDEKVLSEVISEAMSPRRTRTLIRNEEPSQQYAVKVPTTTASSQNQGIVSNKLQEVGQEENNGRILQAN